jgi:hypothetical protein
MADQKEVLGLDLDASGFIRGAEQAKEALGKAMDIGKVSGFNSELLETGLKFGVLAVAALALQETVEAVFEGEKIEQTNRLFEDLTKNFGLAGTALKEDLLKATGGLATTQEATEAANKAIITLGSNANKIPEIMDMARKLTVAFGGDATEKFEQLTYAISTGSQRMLRANGIILDTNKVINDFAAANGVSASALSEAGRQQAIMNAVLKFGETNLKDVGNNTNTATTAWVQFKVAIKEVAEIIDVLISKFLGNALSNAFKRMGDGLKTMRLELEEYFGIGADKAGTHVEVLKNRILNLQKEVAENKRIAGDPFYDEGIRKVAENQVKQAEAQIKQYQEELKKGEKEVQANITAEQKAAMETRKNLRSADLIDTKKAHEEKVKFELEMNKLQLKTAEEAVKNAKTSEDLTKAQNQRKLALEREYKLQVQQLEKQYPGNNPEFVKRKHALLEQHEKQHQQKMLQIERNRFREQEQMNENYLNDSQNAADGVGRAWEYTARKAEIEAQQFGKVGLQVVQSIQKNGESAFQSFGDSIVTHSKSASQIMKGFFLNTLADIAESQGKLYLAMGLVDPTKAAAGAALLVLSGVLRALAGQAGGGGGIGGGGGGGGGGYVGASSSSQTAQNPPEQQAQGQLVVNIQGDFLSTEESQRKILQVVRDATDSTDFKYVQIGHT